MKHYILIILINIILAIVQVSFFYRLFGRTLNPNLIAAFAFSFFFWGIYDKGFFSALIGGIFLDLMGFSSVGLSALILIMGLLLAFYIKKYIFKGWTTQILSLFITTISYSSLLGFPNFYFDLKTVISALITVVISLIFYWTFKSFAYESKHS